MAASALEAYGMLNRFKLRTLYAIHMLAPLAIVEWHLDRLNLDTLNDLASLLR